MNNDEFKQKVRKEVMAKYSNINAMSTPDVQGNLILAEMERSEIEKTIEDGTVTSYRLPSAKSKIKYLDFEILLLDRELRARIKQGRDIDKKRANDKDNVIKNLEAYVRKIEAELEESKNLITAERLEHKLETDNLNSEIDFLICRLNNIALHQ